MVRVAAYLLIGLVAGFAAALLSGWNEPGGREARNVFPQETNLAGRLDRLEAALERERSARLAIEAELAALRESAGHEPPAAASAAGPRDRGPEGIEPSGPGAAGPLVRARQFPRNDPVALSERFVEAGLSAERADYIVRRTEELRLEALQARYDAARDGSTPPIAALRDVNATLRSELGDADFEKYLTALGRPTDVRVSSVLASSPAAQAGFVEGDRIVGYAGQRVYDMGEITELTLAGEPGESVVVDIIRDGQPIQLYLPRGPLGITGGGRFRRGP